MRPNLEYAHLENGIGPKFEQIFEAVNGFHWSQKYRDVIFMISTGAEPGANGCAKHQKENRNSAHA